MKKIVVVGWVVALVGIGAATVPALCQNLGFQIQTPDFKQVVGGLYSVKWEDRATLGANPANITWYYSPNPDGSERRRMVSTFRDDFSRGSFRAKWRPSGPFETDWAVRQEGREKRQFLSGDRNAGHCSSNEIIQNNVVLSVLVRPTTIRNSFYIGLRSQEGVRGMGDGYYIRNDGLKMDIVRVEDGETVLGSASLGQITTQKWYWYEFSLRTRRTEVEVRARVFDEKHQRVLASFGPVTDKLTRRSPLLQGGGIALGAPADYSEVYVDPWESRWTGREQGEFKWDTAGVPAGQYFLVAEIADEKRPAQQVISPFKLDVRPAPGEMQASKADGNR